MLDPSPLSEVGVDLTEAMIRVPSRPIEQDLFLVPGLVALGSDFYEAELHQELQTITSSTAVIGGIVAKRITVEPNWWEQGSTP